jgi:hypothetical protein
MEHSQTVPNHSVERTSGNDATTTDSVPQPAHQQVLQAMDALRYYRKRRRETEQRVQEYLQHVKRLRRTPFSGGLHLGYDVTDHLRRRTAF